MCKLLPKTKVKEAENAWVLVVRKGIDAIVPSYELKIEQKTLTPDT